MLNFIGAILGLLLGVGMAWRRGGNKKDMLHYGAVFALVGFVLGAFTMLVVPAPA
jgi:hypothetical protein